MPGGFWALLSIIIAVYFGGRMRSTQQQMVVKGGALGAAKDIIEARKALFALANDDEQHEPTIARPLALVASKNKEATPTKKPHRGSLASGEKNLRLRFNLADISNPDPRFQETPSTGMMAKHP